MDKPRRRINQGEIENLDMVRVHDLNHVGSGYIQLTSPELGPPRSTLPIDCAIMT